jgi:multidrug efflux pump
VHVIAPNSKQVPLSDLASWSTTTTPLVVNHQGQSPSSTVSFNLAPNVSLSDATRDIGAAFAKIGAPTTVRGSFQATAKAFQDALANQPLLVLAALVAVYLVLGILYESLVHPLTILSTLPSAGVGALLALLVTGTEFSIIASIGVILLIGIVKKNAIMMIDCALQLERDQQLEPREAIHRASLLRLRPILMTTVAAMFGAVIYVYFDRFSAWSRSKVSPRLRRPEFGAGAAVVLMCLLLVGCAVGPDYKRPQAATPPGFKQAAGGK